MVQHLEAAARRGVDVKVVLPKTNDMKIVQDASRFLYPQLLRAGIKVFEYHGKVMAHDKVATFDGQVATIGSSNLDARSLRNNDEANIWANSTQVAAHLDATLFGSDLKVSDVVKGSQRGLVNKVKDFFAWKLSALL